MFVKQSTGLCCCNCTSHASLCLPVFATYTWGNALFGVKLMPTSAQISSGIMHVTPDSPKNSQVLPAAQDENQGNASLQPVVDHMIVTQLRFGTGFLLTWQVLTKPINHMIGLALMKALQEGYLSEELLKTSLESIEGLHHLK